jgi:hypothetical protein
MATVEERYAAATADVRRAIAVLEKRGVAYAVHSDRTVEWYSGPAKAAALRDEIDRLEGARLLARSEAERARIAEAAEALATRASNLVSPAGCERDAGLIDFQTPGSIKAEMDTVAAVVHQLDTDIGESNVDASFKRAWRGFVDEWEQFYKDHEGWFSRWSYSAYEKTVEFRKRAVTWREKFVALGGKPSGPTDQPPHAVGEELWKYGKWLLAGGAILIGWKLFGFLQQREQRRDNRAEAVTRRTLNTSLERLASSRNARARGHRSKPIQLHLDDTELHTWFERDRAHVELRDRRTGKSIVEWWDDDVRQAIEDGFLPHFAPDTALHRAAFDYAKHVGLVEESRDASGSTKREQRYSLQLTRGELEALYFLRSGYTSAQAFVDGLVPLDDSADRALGQEFDRQQGPYRFQIRATDVRKALRATKGDGGNYGAIPNLRSAAVQWVLDEERSRAP